jgi:hypothetical protein
MSDGFFKSAELIEQWQQGATVPRRAANYLLLWRYRTTRTTASDTRPPTSNFSLCQMQRKGMYRRHIHREMLRTDVLKLVRIPVPNDPTSFRYMCLKLVRIFVPNDPTSFRYVCPVCPV